MEFLGIGHNSGFIYKINQNESEVLSMKKNIVFEELICFPPDNNYKYIKTKDKILN